MVIILTELIRRIIWVVPKKRPSKDGDRYGQSTIYSPGVLNTYRKKVMIRKNFSLIISLRTENLIKKEIAKIKRRRERLKIKLYLLISNKAQKALTSLTNACTKFSSLYRLIKMSWLLIFFG